ncbi:MAG: hypothetical protein PVI09_00290 [Anaerolineae bacterium]
MCEGLIEQARRVTDQARRMELYQQADRLIIDKAVVLPLTYDRRHMMLKPWVKRYPISALQNWFWKDVVLEPH